MAWDLSLLSPNPICDDIYIKKRQAPIILYNAPLYHTPIIPVFL